LVGNKIEDKAIMYRHELQQDLYVNIVYTGHCSLCLLIKRVLQVA